MTPPKCRICGMREHNHHCQGGTPAQQVAEQQRVRQLGRATPEAAAPRPLRRWHDDTDSAGEPTEIADYIRKPARFYAPHGQCVYCDRRRAAARVSMRAVRERGEA